MRDICSQNGNYFHRMKIKLMPWSVYIYIWYTTTQMKLFKLLELLKLILTKHIKKYLNMYQRQIFSSCFVPNMNLSWPIVSIYHLSGALVVDVQAYEAIFVGYVYTLTDGPSCRNVSPLLWDVLETPCQLLIQADWWQKETNRWRTLKLSLDDRTYWLFHR